ERAAPRWGVGAASAPLGGLGMVPDDLGDDEVEPLLGELGIEVRLFGQSAQTGDLLLLPTGVGCRHLVLGFEVPDLLGGTEALGQHEDQSGVDVVDAGTQAQQLGAGVICGHDPPRSGTSSTIPNSAIE